MAKVAEKALELSGNPSSASRSSVSSQLRELSEMISDAAIKAALEKLFPTICPCCLADLLSDAAVFLDAYESAIANHRGCNAYDCGNCVGAIDSELAELTNG